MLRFLVFLQVFLSSIALAIVIMHFDPITIGCFVLCILSLISTYYHYKLMN